MNKKIRDALTLLHDDGSILVDNKNEILSVFKGIVEESNSMNEYYLMRLVDALASHNSRKSQSTSTGKE